MPDRYIITGDKNITLNSFKEFEDFISKEYGSLTLFKDLQNSISDLEDRMQQIRELL